ncbi:hypothetical protein [Streptomyces acidicola]|nr:hypothetical protein [Streptomyces acidicola]
MPESTERTALYRYYDADDVLPYVGISTRRVARLTPSYRARGTGDG